MNKVSIPNQENIIIDKYLSIKYENDKQKEIKMNYKELYNKLWKSSGHTQARN